MDKAFAIALIINNWITLPFDVLANSALISFGLKVEDGEIRRNRPVMILTAITELFERVDLALLQVGLYQDNSIASVVLLGAVSHAPTVLGDTLYATFVFVFVLRLVTLPLGFMHRYAAICEYGDQSKILMSFSYYNFFYLKKLRISF
ncbi:hypothetical protein Tcan_12644 [Toxocara canis]|uniref:Uncharacterized protein n=1 Tax=Toxocara canis TaxID=6265 RepID=A0A0B2VLY7_TOXCA|nr:hypothetical protein Tcan_12644 [Toxocara canis]